MRDRFPRIPHLPGSRAAPDDVHLDEPGLAALFARDVIVTEKLDGLRVEIAGAAGGRPVARLKRAFRGALAGEVERALTIYVAQRERLLAPLVQRGGAVYGEWLLHRAGVAYDRLPDLFVAFALRARDGRFVANDVALTTLSAAGLTAARPLYRGRVRTLAQLTRIARGRSRFGKERMEGVVVAVCTAGPDACAKWVRADYHAVTRDELSGAHNALGVLRPR